MKALILATGMALVFLMATTALFQCWTVKRRAAAMTGLYLLSLPPFVAAFFLIPPNLGFLPDLFVENSLSVDLAFGLLLWTAAFFGGILQLYNLADRGFSLRIVMDIDNSETGSMSADQIFASYSAGKGIGWMYQKRLDDLVTHRLARIENGWIGNRRKGRRMALVFRRLRCFLRMDPQE